jgi:iron complex transport system permease protein
VRIFTFIFILLILSLLGCYFHLITGSWEISLQDICQECWNGLWGQNKSNVFLVVWGSRLPRFLVGFFVGASLSVAGCIMQAIFQNPMASPGVMGASSAGIFGAVLCLSIGLVQWLPLFAILASLLSLLFVYMLALSMGRLSVVSLLLIGMAISLFFSSVVTFIITISLHDWEVGRNILSWTLGELTDRRWEHVYIILPCFFIGLAIIIYFLRDLDLLVHGEEMAMNLGVSVSTSRFYLLLASSILTGGAVGVAGMIGFVGLIIPHLARYFVGNGHHRLVFASALLGGSFLVYCDLFVRIFSQWDLRMGTVTGMLGAPYFIFLILKNQQNQT